MVLLSFGDVMFKPPVVPPVNFSFLWRQPRRKSTDYVYEVLRRVNLGEQSTVAWSLAQKNLARGTAPL
jgi:hypothetical protein